ncbi:TonB-dependent receptor [Tunicatimonas pelagia]|uniref:TonB-dependent receptor n=1 Tax=Tunicatimonas pelagia TaxID=931531 RepID=UPI002666754C|nr:TonB-dependent receptor [Tunicatimonas pelagia]WKN43987.1 TonB-dependent receptor [Tunicatimonas pelagia]
MLRLLLVLLPVFYSTFSLAQSYTLSGYVRDAQTGEPLIQATVISSTHGGTTTNRYGYYSLTIPGVETSAADSLQLRFSYVGYAPQTLRLPLQEDIIINVELTASNLLEEVIVEAPEALVHQRTQMSVLSITPEQVARMPALLGEADVLKSLQLLPGVQSGNEGTAGLYVRGGSPDQNLILLDGVPVYNVSHLFGFFSVFNPSSVSYVELIKGGFPARYGGRLSSVLDIRMKEGNMKQFAGEASLGIISGSASIEGPIIKDRASFIISGRRTYLDLIAQPLLNEFVNDDEEGQVNYYFYDLNAKVNARLGKKHHLYLSAYAGQDEGAISDERSRLLEGVQTNSRDNFDLAWGNLTTALRWNYTIAPRWFSNTTLTYSRYDYNNDVTYETIRSGNLTNDIEAALDSAYNFSRQRYRSSIEDWAGRVDVNFTPNPKHDIQFGASAIHHTFNPGAVNYVFDTLASDDVIAGDTLLGSAIIEAWETFVYLEDQWQPSPRFGMNLGVHASAFQVEGETYTSLQPRVSMRYLLAKSLALKASYAQMAQFIHLLTNSGLGLPTDLWVPATERIRPQRAWQAAVGLAKTLRNGLQVSLEGYYKEMDNLLEYRDGADFLNIEEDWQDKVVVGEGRSYGAELLVEQRAGKLTGWVGYTLSWTDRQFDEVNFGERFPFRYDRRHDISVTTSYQWTSKLTASANWVFGTGQAITLPVSSYDPIELADFYFRDVVSEGDVEEIRGRNGFRMQPYHRLDVNIQHSKEKKWGERVWTIGIYNAYNRRNPFFIDRDTLPNRRKQFVQYTLFPILPAISYKLRFE